VVTEGSKYFDRLLDLEPYQIKNFGVQVDCMVEEFVREVIPELKKVIREECENPYQNAHVHPQTSSQSRDSDQNQSAAGPPGVPDANLWEKLYARAIPKAKNIFKYRGPFLIESGFEVARKVRKGEMSPI
jgi:hypothetical protein